MRLFEIMETMAEGLSYTDFQLIRFSSELDQGRGSMTYRHPESKYVFTISVKEEPEIESSDHPDGRQQP